MKHPNRKFVSVLLAVAMVITCFLSFGGVSAAALAPDYTLDPFITSTIVILSQESLS